VRHRGLLDDPLLWLVAPRGSDPVQPANHTWFLAAWAFREVRFERLTEGDARMERIDVATEVVEEGEP
jgi:hypothetical protein